MFVIKLRPIASVSKLGNSVGYFNTNMHHEHLKPNNSDKPTQRCNLFGETAMWSNSQ